MVVSLAIPRNVYPFAAAVVDGTGDLGVPGIVHHAHIEHRLIALGVVHFAKIFVADYRADMNVPAGLPIRPSNMSRMGSRSAKSPPRILNWRRDTLKRQKTCYSLLLQTDLAHVDGAHICSVTWSHPPCALHSGSVHKKNGENLEAPCSLTDSDGDTWFALATREEMNAAGGGAGKAENRKIIRRGPRP